MARKVCKGLSNETLLVSNTVYTNCPSKTRAGKTFEKQNLEELFTTRCTLLETLGMKKILTNNKKQSARRFEIIHEFEI